MSVVFGFSVLNPTLVSITNFSYSLIDESSNENNSRILNAKGEDNQEVLPSDHVFQGGGSINHFGHWTDKDNHHKSSLHHHHGFSYASPI